MTEDWPELTPNVTSSAATEHGESGGHPDFSTAFDLVHPPSGPGAVVFNSPHSGAVYPIAFQLSSRLDALMLRRSEDMAVDLLFGDVVHLGASLLSARFPRAYLDVNREPYELDPRMFRERLPGFANTRSLRVASGLGTVPRTVGDGQDIYRSALSVDEALSRIETLYKPYHRALEQTLQAAHQCYGIAVLIDCHSMPSAAVAKADQYRCDIVIGDRYGCSADPTIPDVIETALRARGYSVARNKPYAGGFITEHYGRPDSNIHAVQIEINRGLYMDERRLVLLPDFEAVKQDIAGVAATLIASVDAKLQPFRLAAE